MNLGMRFCHERQVDLIELRGPPEHGKCENDSACGTVKFRMTKAIWSGKLVLSCWQDILDFSLKKDSEQTKIKVERIYQTIDPELLADLKKPSKSIRSNTGNYTFAGIRSTFMFKLSPIIFSEDNIPAKYNFLTKKIMSNNDEIDPWEVTEIKILKSFVRIDENLFLFNTSV